MLILRKIDVMGVEFVQFDQLIVPDEYRCPISKEIVKDPVISSTGRIKPKPTSEQSNEVLNKAPDFCHIWFVYKGRLIYTREATKQLITAV
ncbi:hypothetical protein SOVF_079450 [Spinacia oleracea]|nr:hypothetical protein SOVF_079450 [Spinacia oleracea]